MTDILISDRLEKIASLITKRASVADIGTDHGYLPIYLVKTGKADRVIACDLRKKPLEKAVKNAEGANVSDCIDFRLSDGLEALEAGEAETLVICGMGGFAIQKILKNGLDSGRIPVGTDCVLSPHTDRESLSRFLYEKGFKIDEEILLHEKAAYYILWKCTFDGAGREGSPADHAYGALLLESKEPELKSYLLREEELLSGVLLELKDLPPDRVGKRIEEIQDRLELNRSVRWF